MRLITYELSFQQRSPPGSSVCLPVMMDLDKGTITRYYDEYVLFTEFVDPQGSLSDPVVGFGVHALQRLV